MEEASKPSNVPVHRIVKSLVLLDEQGEGCICLVPGDKRLSLEKARRALGVGRLCFATNEEMLEMTGYEAGAVPPLGHAKDPRVLMDESLLQFETVVAGGGSPSSLVEISLRPVLRDARARVADVNS